MIEKTKRFVEEQHGVGVGMRPFASSASEPLPELIEVVLLE